MRLSAGSREWWPVATVELTDIDDDAVLWVGTPSDDDRVCSARFQTGRPKFGNGGAFDEPGPRTLGGASR